MQFLPRLLFALNGRSLRKLARVGLRGTAIAFIALQSGCSGGGGDDEVLQSGPPWGRVRADAANSGRGSGTLGDIAGTVELLVDLESPGFGGVSDSGPVLDANRNLFIGTRAGLLAIELDGPDDRPRKKWLASTCTPENGPEVTVGSIGASPSITGEGDIVVVTDAGRVFRFKDLGDAPECRWSYPDASAPGLGVLRSTPLFRIDGATGGPATIVFGTGSGELLALNYDGTEQWRSTLSSGGTISSSPAGDLDGTIYIPSPDGVLHAIDFTGRPRWHAPIGPIAVTDGVLTSTSANSGSYTALANGTIIALDPTGSFRWQNQVTETIVGSLSFSNQLIELPTPTSTPGTATPTPTFLDGTPSPTPTETATPPTALDVVVYAADPLGTVHLVRNATGQTLPEITFGTADAPVPVRLSPVLSADLFVIVGSDDGYLYASNMQGERPCNACDNNIWEDTTPGGAGGRVKIDATTGSPIRAFMIGPNGTIYVTTGDGMLRAIPRPDISPTRTPTITRTPTATPVPPSPTAGAVQ